MEKKNDGGPAFPVSSDAFGSTDASVHGGMSLRDYFAAHALQGLLSNPAIIDTLTTHTREWIGREADFIADAMIASRSTP